VVFTSLHSFQVSSNGAYPQAGLVEGSHGSFYGTTAKGGVYGNGTVFNISENGALTSKYSFTGGNDGGYPVAGLVQGSEGSFYGTTESGGKNGGYGTVFKISTHGVLTSLYSFAGASDGSQPGAGLVQGSDGNFYGTTSLGGSGCNGVVFRISVGLPPQPTIRFTADPTSGTAPLTVQFNAPAVDSLGNTIVGWNWNFGDGATSTAENPSHTYAVAGTFGPALFATNNAGATVTGSGPQITVSFSALLAITQSGTNVVLSWPTNVAGITLQSTTNLVSPGVWTPVAPAPVVVNGQNTVTNPITGAQQFYRLSQ